MSPQQLFVAVPLGQQLNAAENAKRPSNGGSRVRFVVLALSTLCLTLGMCDAMALHFTVICMSTVIVPPPLAPPLNGTRQNASHQTAQLLSAVVVPLFSFAQQGWLFSALAFGTLAGAVLLNVSARLLDFRRMFCLYGCAGGIATICVPAATQLLSAPLNFAAMLAIRVLEGLILAISYVAMENISANWSPLTETTLFMGVISSHFQFGRCITMLLSGLLCDVPWLGWPSIYYLLGSATVALFTAFFRFYKNTPQEHKSVSENELKRIREGRKCPTAAAAADSSAALKEVSSERKAALKMLLSPHVWAVFTSGLGITLGQQLFTQYGPTFFKIAHHVSTNGTGLLTGLPYLCSGIAAPIMGRLCDRFEFLRQNVKLTITLLTTGSQCTIGCCYLVLAFAPLSAPIWLIQLCIIVAVVFNGFWVIGIVKFVKLVSGARTQALNSLNTFVLYSLAMVVPYFVNVVISKETANLEKWNTMFLLTAVVQFVCASLSQISILTVNSRAE